MRRQRARFAHKHQEGGLEGVFGIARVSEDAVTDSQYHRAMPLNQRCKGRLIPPGEELLQELPIRFSGSLVKGHFPEHEPHSLADSLACHGWSSECLWLE